MEKYVVGKSVTSCIGCGSTDLALAGSLGKMPNCNRFVTDHIDALSLPRFELNLVFCSRCKLSQVGTHLPTTEIFSDHYPYFSSASSTWVEHARLLSEECTKRFSLNPDDLVVEIGSNDGYLLRNFKKNCRVLGIEPSLQPAKKALAQGIPTTIEFFSCRGANVIREEHGTAKIIYSLNMLAHSPDLKDILEGVHNLLADDGTFIVEVQYAVEMVKSGKFDTIYHEHFSYFSFTSLKNILGLHGLDIFDVQVLPTHGGSLRVFARKLSNNYPVSSRCDSLLWSENEIGVNGLSFYENLFSKAEKIKSNTLNFFENNPKVFGYGAPTKGNVFLNYCGLSSSDILFTSDRSPMKIGHFTPGSAIPVYEPKHHLYEGSPAVIILPWNISSEVAQLFRDWNLPEISLYTFVPEIKKCL